MARVYSEEKARIDECAKKRVAELIKSGYDFRKKVEDYVGVSSITHTSREAERLVVILESLQEQLQEECFSAEIEEIRKKFGLNEDENNT